MNIISHYVHSNARTLLAGNSLFAMILLIILTLVYSQDTYSASFSDKKIIEQLIDQKMRIDGIPGLTLSVVENGQISWEFSAGLSNIEHATKTTANTIFRSASLAKPLTATAILQLSVDGKIELDKPVWQYCKQFSKKEHTVTSRDLLSHTAGIRSYNMPWSQFEAELFSTKRYKSVSEALTIFANDPLIHKPGSAFKYTSYGYNLLGCVIESVSGMSYEKYLSKHIFEPAGMNNTQVAIAEEVVLNRSGTYRRGKKGVLTNERYVDLTNKFPSGGLLTTSSDLARFSIAYMNGTLLPLPIIQNAIQPTLMTDGSKSFYAMGWDLSKVDEKQLGREMYHVGSTPGVSGIMYLFPETNSALVIFENLYGVKNNEELAKTIAQVLDLRTSSKSIKISDLAD